MDGHPLKSALALMKFLNSPASLCSLADKQTLRLIIVSDECLFYSSILSLPIDTIKLDCLFWKEFRPILSLQAAMIEIFPVLLSLI